MENETKPDQRSWRTAVLWVVVAMAAGFIALMLRPENIITHRWWIDPPARPSDNLGQSFFAIIGCVFLASTLFLSVGNLVFPRSGTRPVLVSLFITAGLFSLIFAIFALAISDIMRWI